MNSECIFCRIISRDIPADLIFETDSIIAFRDINPKAPQHILIVPKKHIDRIENLDENDHCLMGELVYGAKLVAEKLRLDDGYRLIVNNGADAGQEVEHIHLHLLGGRKMTWPPG